MEAFSAAHSVVSRQLQVFKHFDVGGYDFHPRALGALLLIGAELSQLRM